MICNYQISTIVAAIFDIENCFRMFNQIGPISVELTQNIINFTITSK